MKKFFPFGALLVFNFNTFAQSAAFTYQGRLHDGTSPANGSYDLSFALFDTATASTQLGDTLTNAALVVSNGLFTVTLDFGNQFPGADRWLEIRVRTNGGGAFSTLSPRQELTATPYAVQAANAVLAAGVPAGSITSAMLAPGAVYQLSAPGGGLTNVVSVAANGSVGIGPNDTGAALQISGGAVYSNASGATFAGVITNGSPGITNLSIPIRIFISQNRAYVTSFSPGSLEILDVSNPAQPVLLGEAVSVTGKPGSPFTKLSGADGIFATNGIAYVTAESDNALTIMNVSNPQSPRCSRPCSKEPVA